MLTVANVALCILYVNRIHNVLKCFRLKSCRTMLNEVAFPYYYTTYRRNILYYLLHHTTTLYNLAHYTIFVTKPLYNLLHHDKLFTTSTSIPLYNILHHTILLTRSHYLIPYTRWEKPF